MASLRASNLIWNLINAAEKASNIARICRSNEELLSLLVQEKSGDEANKRFDHDFKTLADVLIQETVRHDLGSRFPDLRTRIRGEESSTFTNSEGETVSITVGADIAETAKVLTSILRDYPTAVDLLALEVHRTVEYIGPEIGEIPELPEDFNYNSMGIWIDPIDATAEYISGKGGLTKLPKIASTGLDCVTVLIGVFDCDNGEPVIGVISQPFHKEANIYRSSISWGICLPQLKANNYVSKQFDNERLHTQLVGICSSSENQFILQQLIQLDYDIVFSAGAGYKALKIITGEVDLYILSKGSTFKWDTCAPQAILRSMDGNIYDFYESFHQSRAIPLNYLSKDDEGNSKCNKGGLIAVRDAQLMEELLKHQEIRGGFLDKSTN